MAEDKFNKGDVSEGILAAAITARFINKTEDIDSRKVLSVIGKLGRPKKVRNFSMVEKKFSSANENPNIVDTVVCKISLADVNMNAFLNKSIYSRKEIVELVNAAIAYANSVNIKEWADMVYTNNQENFIEVNSEGLLDQTGTKVDIRVLIDGQQAGVGISLKAGDVKQFGQVGGATKEAMEEYFGPLGVKFNKKTLTDFENMVANKKVTEALILMYKEASTQIKKKIKTNQKEFIEDLSNFMKFHATRNEPDVALVTLNKNEATLYDFDKLSKKLKGLTLDVEYNESSTDVIKGKKIPQFTIVVVDSKIRNNGLLTLRNKLEGNRVNSKGKKVGLTVRNYVEKEHMTKELITESYA